MPPSSIADLTLFRTVPDELRARIAKATITVEAAEGIALFRQGQPASFAWAVEVGRVNLVRTDASGRNLILEIFSPEDCFGAVVALLDRSYPASAIAAEDSVVWKLPAEVLREVARRHQHVQVALLSIASTRLGRAHDRLCMTVFEHVEQRLARAVLALSEHGSWTNTIGTVVPVAHQELADSLGTSIETVSRIVSRWRRAGVVGVTRGRLKLLDLDGLRRMAAGHESPNGG